MSRITGVNPSKAKRQNEVAMKEIVYKYGPISRAHIANMMGLTLPTITTNISELINLGSMREIAADESTASLGRKVKPIDIEPEFRYVVGVEVAPNRCVFCLADLRLGHLQSEEIPRDNHDYDEMLLFLKERINALISASGVPRSKIAGVGVGVPGFVERKTGVIRHMGRFQWYNKSLSDELSQIIDLPVCVENNVRVRVIGEDMLNGRVRPDTFAYYFVSLGIACPLLIKNSLFSGQSAGAGEIGHMIIQSNGPKCDICGKNGCLDALASDTAVLKCCKSALEMGTSQILQGFVEQSGQLTMQEVLSAQQAGDTVVQSIVKQTLSFLGIALANAINFMSPEMVVVDAYIMRLPQNREIFMQTLHNYMFGINETEVAIEFAEHDPLRGAKGAASFAIRQFWIRQ